MRKNNRPTSHVTKHALDSLLQTDSLRSRSNREIFASGSAGSNRIHRVNRAVHIAGIRAAGMAAERRSLAQKVDANGVLRIEWSSKAEVAALQDELTSLLA